MKPTLPSLRRSIGPALGLIALFLVSVAAALPGLAQEPLYSEVPVLPDDCFASTSLAEPNSARRLAVSPSGDIYVAMNGYLSCGQQTASSVWVSKSADRGQSFGAPVTVLEQLNPDFYPMGDPSIAVDAAGVVHVAWMGTLRLEQGKRALQVSGPAIFYSRSVDAGTTFSPPVPIAEGLETTSHVHLAVDAPYVYVLPTAGDALYVNGASGVGSFTATPVDGFRVFSDVHVDPATAYVYVQTDDPFVRVYRSTDHGATFGPPSSWADPPIDVYFSNAALGAGPSGAASLFVAGSELADRVPARGESPYPSRTGHRAGGVRATDVGEVGWRIDLATMTPTAIEVGVNFSSYGRQLAADGCGNLVDAYIGYPEGPVGYIRTSTDGGNTWGEEILVAWGTTRMHVAIHPLTKDVIVLYESEGGPLVNVYEGLLVNCNCPPGGELLTPTSVCQGSVNDASIGPFEGVTYYWSITPYSGNASILGPGDGPSIEWRADLPGRIAVEVTIFGPGCVKRFWKIVDINATPSAPVITSPAAVATGQTGLVASVPADAGSTFAWTVTNGTITAGQGTNAITFTAGTPGSLSFEVVKTTAAGCVSPKGTATIPVSGPGGPCVADGTTLCLNVQRFEVKVSWKTTDGTTGQGHAIPFAPAPPDSGYFWFFEEPNMELIIKVLDGRGVNGKFWVMYGALSDVEYTITVRDTYTDAVRTYHNAQGTLASVADVEAFSDAPVRPSVALSRAFSDLSADAAGVPVSFSELLAAATPAHRAEAPAASILVAVPFAACTGDATTLCLNTGRFKATASWRIDRPTKTNGLGHSVPVTTDSGCFWFFNDRNIELAVKVLDGRGVNGKFWVLYGALSDVAYDLRIEDTVTGAVKTYSNPKGTLASVADIEVFTP